MSQLISRAKGKIKREYKKLIHKVAKSNIEVVVLCNKEQVDEYKKVCRFLQKYVKITDIRVEASANARQYVYAPKEEAIDSNQFLQAIFCLLSSNYDYVLVSEGLLDYPEVSGVCIEDILVKRYSYVDVSFEDMIKNESVCGRLLRLPGMKKQDCILDFNKYSNEISITDEFILQSNGKMIPEYTFNIPGVKYSATKPVVFVVPIFMAVGGVERNTIEMMRALKDEYTFVVLTMERHMNAQGSLHDQLYGLCDAIYDMRELFEFNDYLDVLKKLKDIYSPKVMWLCNNSPWFEANTEAIRIIFSDVNVVMQDCYDTQYGWIEYYDRPGIQSFDRYIAINEKIKNVFINKYSIDEDSIDVIYSAVDDSRIRSEKTSDSDTNALYSKYGLNPSKKHFALIGRMTEQKNPIRYLNIIKSVYKKYPEIEFVIVGDGVLGEQVNEYIKENDLSEVVKRILFVKSTPELFRILDGLVLTSVYEGLAIVSIEAMSLGVPILSTDTGDLKLFLDKTNGGIIIGSEDDDVECFEKLYSNLEKYREKAIKHSDEILDFFSAKNIAKQYKDAFSKKS